MEAFFDDASTSDIDVVLVDSCKQPMLQLCLHRVVLARCPAFRTMLFEGCWSESDRASPLHLPLENYSPGAYRDFFHCLYQDRLRTSALLDCRHILELHSLAHRWGFDALERKAGRAIACGLRDVSIRAVVEYCGNDPRLQRACVQWLKAFYFTLGLDQDSAADKWVPEEWRRMLQNPLNRDVIRLGQAPPHSSNAAIWEKVFMFPSLKGLGEHGVSISESCLVLGGQGVVWDIRLGFGAGSRPLPYLLVQCKSYSYGAMANSSIPFKLRFSIIGRFHSYHCDYETRAELNGFACVLENAIRSPADDLFTVTDAGSKLLAARISISVGSAAAATDAGRAWEARTFEIAVPN